MGDMATNDGKAGHQTRHHDVLNALVRVLRSVYGSTVEYEPSDYKDYSDGRPDVVRHRPEGLWAGDVKVKDPIGSSPAACGVRGGYVGFGNTAPGAHDEVLGREQRGEPGGAAFDPATGAGYVAPLAAPYDRARLEHGVDVDPLLFETFLGWGEGTVRLLREAAEARGNKLRGSEYEATTWSARTWMGYAAQRVSCALARAVAWELATAMELTRVRDSRDD